MGGIKLRGDIQVKPWRGALNFGGGHWGVNGRGAVSGVVVYNPIQHGSQNRNRVHMDIGGPPWQESRC